MVSEMQKHSVSYISKWAVPNYGYEHWASKPLFDPHYNTTYESQTNAKEQMKFVTYPTNNEPAEIFRMPVFFQCSGSWYSNQFLMFRSRQARLVYIEFNSFRMCLNEYQVIKKS